MEWAEFGLLPWVHWVGVLSGGLFPSSTFGVRGSRQAGKQAVILYLSGNVCTYMCDRPDGVLVLMLQAMRTSRRS